jgi:hypothetical protein
MVVDGACEALHHRPGIVRSFSHVQTSLPLIGRISARRVHVLPSPPPLGGGHNQSSATFLQRFCDRPDATFSLRRSAARATDPVGRSTACKGEKCAN